MATVFALIIFAFLFGTLLTTFAYALINRRRVLATKTDFIPKEKKV